MTQSLVSLSRVLKEASSSTSLASSISSSNLGAVSWCIFAVGTLIAIELSLLSLFTLHYLEAFVFVSLGSDMLFKWNTFFSGFPLFALLSWLMSGFVRNSKIIVDFDSEVTIFIVSTSLCQIELSSEGGFYGSGSLLNLFLKKWSEK